MAFMFQGRSSFSWRWMFRATKHQQNRKCWKNSRTLPRRPSPNNPWARRHCWDQLWSLPGENLPRSLSPDSWPISKSNGA
jgi:hypothetical protein